MTLQGTHNTSLASHTDAAPEARRFSAMPSCQRNCLSEGKTGTDKVPNEGCACAIDLQPTPLISA